ncbi:hypothetical protein MTO96_030797 [Rhipicephalus appendiculatus]
MFIFFYRPVALGATDMRPPSASTPIPFVVLLVCALVLVPNAEADLYKKSNVGCPVLEHCGCYCTKRARFVRCMNITQAHHLDEDMAQLMGKTITEFNLIGVNISDLPSKWFTNRTLRGLEIIACPLRQISEEVLSSINGLSVLKIKQSQLQTVPRGPKALTYLRVNENPVRLLQGVLVMPDLYQLHLSTNEIEGIDEDYFSGSPNLQRLVLYDNKIRRLPAAIFKMTKKLKIINLRRNRIDAIGSEFHQLPYLEAVRYLWLTENPIKFLQGVLPMPELYELDLSCNEIEGIDEGYFSLSTNLHVLKLHGNKIHRPTGRHLHEDKEAQKNPSA